MARSTARATSRMSVALGQAPGPPAYESLLLGPPPLAEAVQQLQLLGWPTHSERIRVALGPAGGPLPTPADRGGRPPRRALTWSLTSRQAHTRNPRVREATAAQPTWTACLQVR